MFVYFQWIPWNCIFIVHASQIYIVEIHILLSPCPLCDQHIFNIQYKYRCDNIIIKSSHIKAELFILLCLIFHYSTCIYIFTKLWDFMDLFFKNVWMIYWKKPTIDGVDIFAKLMSFIFLFLSFCCCWFIKKVFPFLCRNE